MYSKNKLIVKAILDRILLHPPDFKAFGFLLFSIFDSLGLFQVVSCKNSLVLFCMHFLGYEFSISYFIWLSSLLHLMCFIFSALEKNGLRSWAFARSILTAFRFKNQSFGTQSDKLLSSSASSASLPSPLSSASSSSTSSSASLSLPSPLSSS